MSDEDLERRMKDAERVLAEVAAGNLDQTLNLSDLQDPFASLEMGINFMIMDLRAMAKREQVHKQELLDKQQHLERQLKIITKQRQAIRELATPVIQIWQDVVMLPLIGTIDAERGEQIVESLLGAIASYHARVAIVDITGVPVINAQVADYFLKAIMSANMLGARVILTGVTPGNARTLVTLNVDLSGIITTGTLQAGLQQAVALLR